MKANLKQLKCGGCGGENHRIYSDDKNLFIECIDCKAITKVSASKPELIIEADEDSDMGSCLADFGD